MIKLLYVGDLNKGYRVLEVLLAFQKQKVLAVVAVISAPDGYDEHWYKSVARLASENSIPVFTSDVNDKEFCRMLKDKFAPDWGLSNGSTMRLYKEQFFDLPKNGFLNIHFSPLPKYRGMYPIPYAIINDEKHHGFTVHKIEAGMDTGDIVYQEGFPLYESDTGYTAYHRCEDLVVNFARKELLKILTAEKLVVFEQDHSKATTHKLRDMPEKRADLKHGMRKCYNFVRAFDFPPYDPAFIEINNERFYLTTIPIDYGMKHGECHYWQYEGYKIFLIPEATYDSVS